MPPIEGFIAKWRPSAGSELGSSQSFILELCDLLGVPKPAPPRPQVIDNAYAFEAQIEFTRADGSRSTGRIDLYKKGFFIWESKQGSPKVSKTERDKTGGWRVGTAVRDTRSWDTAMIKARAQAMEYAAGISKEEGHPPFIIVADIGLSLDIYSDFNGTGLYTPFPSARDNRIYLEDLRREDIRERLYLIWTNPLSLDPAREREKVTLDIAVELGDLAKSLEASGHDPEDVSRFIMKLIFTFFAEDTNLLPVGHFADILDNLKSPDEFEAAVSALWFKIRGTTGFFEHPIRRFHSLFATPKSLPVNQEQLDLLKKAARANWASVEPPIFGTLLERALNPAERHRLGAHYTPTAYVERLVYPTIIEPLRADWSECAKRALALVYKGDHDSALYEVRQFHKQLGETYVLDPSCGGGNVLATALNALKILEADVITALKDLGQTDLSIIQTGYQVSPHQFRGIDVSPHAASIAELVIMISYIQKHYELYGNVFPPEPTVYDYMLVERRDALLAWDKVEKDGSTQLIPRRAAAWPAADFIIGNPPFLGIQKMRKELGDDYVKALRKAWPEVPASADFCMYWWHNAANLVRDRNVRRFGLITTSSINQKHCRKVVEYHMKANPPLVLAFAIPDHPWGGASEESINKAQVRIAMTVGTIEDIPGTLTEVILDRPGKEGDGFRLVNYDSQIGRINSNLTIGVDVGRAKALKSNSRIASLGMSPNGKGFIVTPSEAEKLGLGTIPGLEKHIRPYRNGKDIAAKPRNLLVIDLYGLTIDEVKKRYPAVYQHLVDNVKPVREKNNRKAYRDKWWIFGEPRAEFRPALEGLRRYISSPQTARRRYFVFMDKEIIPDAKLINVASDDAYILGVLSSRIHQEWILAAGGKLGIGNDPVYVKSTCFDAFPFPEATEGQKQQIRALADKIDAHRKQRQEENPKLTLTDMYAILEDMRYGVHLDPKKEKISQQGDLAALFELHKQLDGAVTAAYGWAEDISSENLLENLLELNHKRANEEKRAQILWLRPEYQATNHGLETVGEKSRQPGDTVASSPGAAYLK